MHICSLRLKDFRNYSELDLQPGSGLNIFVGENAQGKSNLLEAIHLLATTRSIRAGRESEMIRRAEEGLCLAAQISAELERNREGEILIDVSVLPNDHKSVRINGSKKPRVVDLLGHLNAVFFGAVELAIVTADPSIRRRYLNMEISQVSPKYVNDLGNYKKALEHRNRLLKELRERPNANSGLEAWNEQVVVYGSSVIEKRLQFIERLAPLADQMHQEISDGRENLAVHYVPSIDCGPGATLPQIELAYRERQLQVAGDELRRGVTLIGPQRDDLNFSINSMDARAFGSQGQQRTVALALKLAEHKLMQDYVDDAPIVLLDDVMSDLDDIRRGHLLNWVDGKCQTFITCTNLRPFSANVLEKARVWKVESGHLIDLGTSHRT